jgi:hypothetical protein
MDIAGVEVRLELHGLGRDARVTRVLVDLHQQDQGDSAPPRF